MRTDKVFGIAAGLAVAFTFTSGPALQAQTIKVRNGDKVSMTSTTGRHAEGIVRGVDPASLTVLVNGKQEQWTLAESREIWKHGDPVRNGLLYGALIGTAAGVAGGFAMAAIVNNEGGDGGLAFLSMSALGAGGGGAFGAAFDAMRQGRTLLHRASTPTVVVTPAVSRHVRGLQVAVRF